MVAAKNKPGQRAQAPVAPTVMPVEKFNGHRWTITVQQVFLSITQDGECFPDVNAMGLCHAFGAE